MIDCDAKLRSIQMPFCSKLGQRAGLLFSKAENIDLVITGQQANAEIVEELKALGIKVVLV
ncbi:hypothetical protein [Escherichia coli]|uniref:hypothetical protein n=1 Tax=Escherichia coli TaxID=562 RepID=UPI0010CB21B1|nr:hypothetical protein [Escherichia coli]